MSGKLDARQFAWISPSATKLGSPSVALKISRKWWMSSEQRIQLRIPTICGKLFPYYIYICLEQNKSSNQEILVSGSHFQTLRAFPGPGSQCPGVLVPLLHHSFSHVGSKSIWIALSIFGKAKYLIGLHLQINKWSVKKS